MSIDLSSLDTFNSSDFLAKPAAPASQDMNVVGKAMELKINLIDEDPNQPRKKMDQAKLKEMADSIKAKRQDGSIRGVKSPISVRENPEAAGRYIINHGHRRYQGAKLAGLDAIPAFVDQDHDDYDQVIENVQREGLTPLEVSHFIQKRLKAGDKKGVIAKALGKSASYVADHAVFEYLALSIRELYDNGLCDSVQGLALLQRAYEKYPDRVEIFCQDSTEGLSVAQIRHFIDSLKEHSSQSEQVVQEPEIDCTPGGEDEVSEVEFTPENSEAASSSPDNDNYASNEDKKINPEVIKKAILQVRHDDREARLLMSKRSAYGLAWVKYDDNGEELEVDAATVSLVAVIEA